MQVFGVWNGGANYASGTAPEDLESFSSITAAKGALLNRATGGHWFQQDFAYVNKPAERALTPNADEGAHIWLYATAESDEAFALLEFGPRGGVKRTNL